MIDYDVRYALGTLGFLGARLTAALQLAGRLYDLMTDEEREGARQVGMPEVYSALRHGQAQLAELKVAFEEARLGWEDSGGVSTEAEDSLTWQGILDRWRETHQVLRWVDRQTDLALDAARASDMREAVVDKMVLLASTTEVLRAASWEVRNVLKAVCVATERPSRDPEPEPVYPSLETAQDIPRQPDPGDDEYPALEVTENVNPIVWALDRRRDEIVAAGGNPSAQSDPIHVGIVGGRYKGVSIGQRGNPTPYYEPWWGDAEMCLHGRGVDRTTILAAHGEAGWGSTLTIKPAVGWTGRLHLTDATIECSGGNAVEAGAYGTQALVPMWLSFQRIKFVDHPNSAVRCVRPISVNQVQVQFFDCSWACPNSQEHAVYRRNGFGRSGMWRCHVRGVGGQVWQDVGRPSEGPAQERGQLVFEDCWFQDFHRFAGRAGSAITQAGSGVDLLARRCTLVDLDWASDPSRPDVKSHGGLLAWSGGHYHPIPSGRANYSAVYHECDVVLVGSDRGPAAFDSVDAVELVDCGLYSSNGRPVMVGTQGSDSVGRFSAAGCNSLDVLDRLRQKGFLDEQLVDPHVLVGVAREDRGPLSAWRD